MQGNLSVMTKLDGVNVNDNDMVGESNIPLNDIRKKRMTVLRSLRKSNGYTLEGLSLKTGISVSYLSRLESGSRRLNMDLIHKLASVFQCEPAVLVQNEGSDSTGLLDSRRRRKGSVGIRDARLPMYKLVECYRNEDVEIELQICPSEEWEVRPKEFSSKEKIFALRADQFFVPYFNKDAILYVEESDVFVPEDTIIILNSGKAMIKKIWSITPKAIQVCSVDDVEVVKKEDRYNKLVSLDRSDLKTVYKVIGYYVLY